MLITSCRAVITGTELNRVNQMIELLILLVPIRSRSLCVRVKKAEAFTESYNPVFLIQGFNSTAGFLSNEFSGFLTLAEGPTTCIDLNTETVRVFHPSGNLKESCFRIGTAQTEFQFRQYKMHVDAVNAMEKLVDEYFDACNRNIVEAVSSLVNLQTSQDELIHLIKWVSMPAILRNPPRWPTVAEMCISYGKEHPGVYFLMSNSCLPIEEALDTPDEIQRPALELLIDRFHYHALLISELESKKNKNKYVYCCDH
ncbi:hypothetical protein Ciccas_003123 [Cichlidogyrus casuarinus]|uniref:Uncharacterized protein n=1 Tax=Cichlidogyrus casuarinus TaxID=1844966 RepID=A0ABD2QF99_9PLAT